MYSFDGSLFTAVSGNPFEVFVDYAGEPGHEMQPYVLLEKVVPRYQTLEFPSVFSFVDHNNLLHYILLFQHLDVNVTKLGMRNLYFDNGWPVSADFMPLPLDFSSTETQTTTFDFGRSLDLLSSALSAESSKSRGCWYGIDQDCNADVQYELDIGSRVQTPAVIEGMSQVDSAASVETPVLDNVTGEITILNESQADDVPVDPPVLPDDQTPISVAPGTASQTGMTIPTDIEGLVCIRPDPVNTAPVTCHLTSSPQADYYNYVKH